MFLRTTFLCCPSCWVKHGLSISSEDWTGTSSSGTSITCLARVTSTHSPLFRVLNSASSLPQIWNWVLVLLQCSPVLDCRLLSTISCAHSFPIQLTRQPTRVNAPSILTSATASRDCANG